MAENAIIKCIYSKTTLVIVYMVVKLITMPPDFFLFSTVYSITVRGAVIYYESLVGPK